MTVKYKMRIWIGSTAREDISCGFMFRYFISLRHFTCSCLIFLLTFLHSQVSFSFYHWNGLFRD